MTTMYVEAYERVKVLKEEYDGKFAAWLDAANCCSDSRMARKFFRDVVAARGRLDDASRELAGILAGMKGLPEGIVVTVSH